MSGIYALIDPRSKRPKYVGCTHSDYDTRLSMHVASARRALKIHGPPGLSEKDKWVFELLEAGLRPTMKILSEVPRADAGRTEMEWINKYRIRGERLFNVSAPPGMRGRVMLQNREEGITVHELECLIRAAKKRVATAGAALECARAEDGHARSALTVLETDYANRKPVSP